MNLGLFSYRANRHFYPWICKGHSISSSNYSKQVKRLWIYKRQSISSLCQVGSLTVMTCDVKPWRGLPTQVPHISWQNLSKILNSFFFGFFFKWKSLQIVTLSHWSLNYSLKNKMVSKLCHTLLNRSLTYLS
jgi:hypothetical protein